MHSPSIRLYLSASCMILLIISCRDFIEKPLSKESLNVLMPSENYLSSSNTITFWWEEPDEALHYKVQVVKPSFGSIQQLVLDTLMTSSKLTYILPPGNYQWRVRAQNNSSNSPYTTRSLTVDTTAPVVSILSYPGQGDSVTSPVVIKWKRMAGTLSDSLFIYSDSLVSPVLYAGYFTPDTSCTYSNTSGIYFWQLRSFDAAGNGSAYSAAKKMVIK